MFLVSYLLENLSTQDKKDKKINVF